MTRHIELARAIRILINDTVSRDPDRIWASSSHGGGLDLVFRLRGLAGPLITPNGF